MLLEDFYEEVLRKLTVLPAEEPATASDRLEAKNKYEQVHAEYHQRELLPFFDDEDVPDEFADPLAAITAFRLTTTFTVPNEVYVRLGRASIEGNDVIIGTNQRRNVPRQKAVYY